MASTTQVTNEIKDLTAIQLASGVALNLSGYSSLNDTILVYSGVENGTLTFSGAGYCNSTSLTKAIVAGTVYGIADLNGSKLEKTNSMITICGPSGTLYPISLSA